MVLPVAQQPHRPGPLHQTNKLHKGGRHVRKNTATSEIKSKSIAKPNSNARREDRLNQANQSRKLKRDKAIEEKRNLGFEHQPPLLVGVLDLDLNECLSFINGLKSLDESIIKVEIVNEQTIYVVSTRYKTRFKLRVLNSSTFDDTLDLVKSLDLLILLHKPDSIEQKESRDVSLLLRSIYLHCQPSIVHVIDGTDKYDGTQAAKKMINAKRVLKARINDEKMHCIEKQQDYSQLLHTISNCKKQKSHFKDARPIVDSDKAEVIGDSLTLTGFVRKKILSPNDLVHIVGYDDYQIKKIEVLPDIIAFRPYSIEVGQVVQTLMPNLMKQETLEQENDFDPMEGEQTWPTAEELAIEAERRNTKKIYKKLPPGTSEYQGAWIPDDSGDELQDDSSSDDEGEIGDANMKDITAGGESDAEVFSEEDNGYDEEEKEEEGQAVAMDVDVYDKNHSKDKELKILEKLREARLDEMFPDEIDTPAETPARVRFAKYRGLKSFRTSAWDPQENLPPDYSRIFQFQNFSQTKRRVLSEPKEEGVSPGLYVRIHLANVPDQVIKDILSRPVAPNLIGLLKYERKMSVMNVLIKRLSDSNLGNPIKSKDELIFYVGHRKFKARPLLTTHSISSKFKYERFLRDDVAMVATMYAPITFPPAPVLVFRLNYRGEKELVASGSVLDPNPNRLIIKRIRLSGHPFKIHSKTAVIRFMFFNSEDVLYFKPVELTSKYNRRGHIREPLGTHGHMKCTFDKKIRSDDCIFMNLYKRVFPKWSYAPLFQL